MINRDQGGRVWRATRTKIDTTKRELIVCEEDVYFIVRVGARVESSVAARVGARVWLE